MGAPENIDQLRLSAEYTPTRDPRLHIMSARCLDDDDAPRHMLRAAAGMVEACHALAQYWGTRIEHGWTAHSCHVAAAAGTSCPALWGHTEEAAAVTELRAAVQAAITDCRLTTERLDERYPSLAARVPRGQVRARQRLIATLQHVQVSAHRLHHYATIAIAGHEVVPSAPYHSTPCAVAGTRVVSGTVRAVLGPATYMLTGPCIVEGVAGSHAVGDAVTVSAHYRGSTRVSTFAVHDALF